LYLANGYQSNTESSYGYTGQKGICYTSKIGTQISNVQEVASNEDALAVAAANQVVSIGITFEKGTGRSFMNYKSGVFDGVCQNKDPGRHAIATVGVQSDYFIVRNSWGVTWGMGGYAFIKRGSNVCDLAQFNTIATAKPDVSWSITWGTSGTHAGALESHLVAGQSTDAWMDRTRR
jgi:hypothetical protein